MNISCECRATKEKRVNDSVGERLLSHRETLVNIFYAAVRTYLYINMIFLLHTQDSKQQPYVTGESLCEHKMSARVEGKQRKRGNIVATEP